MAGEDSDTEQTHAESGGDGAIRFRRVRDACSGVLFVVGGAVLLHTSVTRQDGYRSVARPGYCPRAPGMSPTPPPRPRERFACARALVARNRPAPPRALVASRTARSTSPPDAATTRHRTRPSDGGRSRRIRTTPAGSAHSRSRVTIVRHRRRLRWRRR